MPYHRIEHKKPKIYKWTKRHALAFGNEVASIIIRRTQAEGLGVDDSPLPKHSQIKKNPRLKSLGAYSLSYAKYRLKKGLDISKVRLSVTGNMFRQFRTVASESGVWVVRVRPTGGSRRYAKHTNDLRPWIGISAKDRDKVQNAFRAIWDAVQ